LLLGSFTINLVTRTCSLENLELRIKDLQSVPQRTMRINWADIYQVLRIVAGIVSAVADDLLFLCMRYLSGSLRDTKVNTNYFP
jgi:hypothetical protein